MYTRRTIMRILPLMGILLASGAFAYGSEWAFSGLMPGGHHGPVQALLHKGDTILSAGEDGFLEIWNIRSGGGPLGGQAAQRFQVSPNPIIAMAERPETDEVCLLENEGLGLYRVSVWNYKERRRLFSLQLRELTGSLSYSMGGNFIIAGRSGLASAANMAFIDSRSGTLMQSPQSLTAVVTLAATGRSERNMLVYSISGGLSYWDLESGSEISHFDVPAHLSTPALFSNNRYLAGITAGGLAVINAVSGEVLAWEDSIPAGSLLCSAGDELICLTQTEEDAAELYRYAINRGGSLVCTGNFSLRGSRFTAIAAAGNTIALGTSDGYIVLAGMNGQPRTLTTKDQTSIIEAEVSGNIIAFFSGDDTLGFIPLDYTQIPARRSIRVEQNQEAYNRITAFTAENANGQFIFWQDKNTRTLPIIRSAGYNGAQTTIDGISFRSPLRSSDSLDGKILFLDSTGNLFVTAPFDTDKKRPFTFFSVGIMDAAFIDHERIIIGRSAVSGNTPFLVVNVNTGETVPLPHPTPAGVITHRGASGTLYAAETDSAKTSIFHFDPAIITGSSSLFDFQGEDTHFSLAETPEGIAANIGGADAAIYTASGIQALDRSGGFPLKLINGGSWLISLDKDGSLCWHDNRSGKLLAIFRLHPDGWTLQTERSTISGGISH